MIPPHSEATENYLNHIQINLDGRGHMLTGKGRLVLSGYWSDCPLYYRLYDTLRKWHVVFPSKIILIYLYIPAIIIKCYIAWLKFFFVHVTRDAFFV